MMLYPIVVVFVFLLLGLEKVRNLFFANSILTVIILMVFFVGIADMFKLPSFIYNMILEALVLGLLIFTDSSANRRGRSFRVPGGRIFLLFTLIVFLSIYINKSDLFQSYLYYRFFLTPYLFMLIILNINISEEKILKLISFFEFIFLFQLIATVIKLLLLGRPEHPVGTIIITGGGVATYLPLIAAGFLLSRYFLYKKDKMYLLLLFSFPLIAFASQKRGTFIFMPVIFVLFVYFLGKFDMRARSLERKIRYYAVLGVAAFVLLIFGAKTTRTMNPERSTRGTFNFEYLVQSSIEYNTLEGKYAMGRVASFRQVNKVMKEADPKNTLFGFGPATLKGAARADGRFERFGVGGTYPGISYQFIQIGVLGGLVWPLLYAYFVYCIIRYLKRERDKYWISFGIGSLVMIFLFFIDYFTYSVTFITTYAFTFTIATAFGLIMRRYFIIRSLNYKKRKTIASWSM